MCSQGTCQNCSFNAAYQNRSIHQQAAQNAQANMAGSSLGLLNTAYAQNQYNQQLGNIYGASVAYGGRVYQAAPDSQLRKRMYFGKIINPKTQTESRILNIVASYIFSNDLLIVNPSGCPVENIIIEGKMFDVLPENPIALKYQDHDENEILLKCWNVVNGTNQTLRCEIIDNLKYLELKYECSL